MKDNNKTKCDPCEQDFKKKVNELVKEGKAPTHNERMKTEHEVKGAFGHQHVEHKMPGKMDKHDTHKEPAMAGMHKKK